jgi:hypothetical protein
MAISRLPSAPHPAQARPGRGQAGQPAPVGGRGLTISIGATHRAVTAVLDSEKPDADHIAIARLSAHLAAMRHIVYPVARRQPGPARQVLVTYLDSARELDWALRLLHCNLTGEAFAVRHDPNAAYARFQHYLGCYASAEGALVALLDEQLPACDRDQVAARYRKALAHAPTRPHPRRPHTGAVYQVRFRLHGFWDRLLDTTDARPGTGRGFPPPAPEPAEAPDPLPRDVRPALGPGSSPR